MKLTSELGQVNVIQIPRCITSERDTKKLVYELEAFSDASTSACATAVYLVIKSRISTQLQLIASKTHVAPLRKQTIPRMELLAALVPARLTARIKTTLEQCLVISRVHCWRDSNNVLYWTKGMDKEWKQFVSHRVAEIRQLLPTDVWAHVPGMENPADLASRGVNLLSLARNALWWNGPTWSSSQEEAREEEDVPEMIPPPLECVKEMNVQAARDLEESTSLLVTNTHEVGIAHITNCEDYSDFSKLCRVTAYVIHFVNNIKAWSSKTVSPVGSGSFTSEVLFSESLWILESQKSLLLN